MTWSLHLHNGIVVHAIYPIFCGPVERLGQRHITKIWRKIWIINSLSNLGSSTTWGWCILDYHTLHCRKNWLRDLTANRSITELWDGSSSTLVLNLPVGLGLTFIMIRCTWAWAKLKTLWKLRKPFRFNFCISIRLLEMALSYFRSLKVECGTIRPKLISWPPLEVGRDQGCKIHNGYNCSKGYKGTLVLIP